jgi:GntR family transcriptional regulator/MocR family aminotransferase
LREAIADYLTSARTVRCKPSQVIIVSGSQQALDLVSRVLSDPGECVWMEDPGYAGARAAFLGGGLRVEAIPLDREGLNLEYAIENRQSPRIIYVTPSHQFPLGMTMSLSRRMTLLEFAERWKSWIIEDDYDSEYRYSGRPLSSLQGLDRSGRVIYVGTFSKVLFPALRLGYMVVPEHLVDAFTSARAMIDRHSPTIEQAVLADFIREGDFTRHIRRMRVLYLKRQNALVAAVQKHLKSMLHVEPADAGMHLVGWLSRGIDGRKLAEAATARGVDVTPLSRYSIRKLQKQAILLGYTGWSEQRIAQAVQKLAEAVTAGTQNLRLR